MNWRSLARPFEIIKALSGGLFFSPTFFCLIVVIIRQKNVGEKNAEGL
jgi:hypothetical protein